MPRKLSSQIGPLLDQNYMYTASSKKMADILSNQYESVFIEPRTHSVYSHRKPNVKCALTDILILLFSCSNQDIGLTKGAISNQNSDTSPLGLLKKHLQESTFFVEISNLPTDGWSTFIIETDHGKKFIDDFHGEKDVDEHDV